MENERENKFLTPDAYRLARKRLEEKSVMSNGLSDALRETGELKQRANQLAVEVQASQRVVAEMTETVAEIIARAELPLIKKLAILSGVVSLISAGVAIALLISLNS